MNSDLIKAVRLIRKPRYIRVVNKLRALSKYESRNAVPLVANEIQNYRQVLDYIATTAPVTVNLNKTTMPYLVQDTHYRSAHETLDKSINYMCHRYNWEAYHFMDIYNDATPFEKPKYGALNYLNHPQGVCGAEHYGTWFIVLKPTLRKRVSCTFGDSFADAAIGVLDHCAHVIGEMSIDELKKLSHVVANRIPFAEYTTNNYIECQIHGAIELATDIASINVPWEDLRDEHLLRFSKKFNVPIVGFHWGSAVKHMSVSH